MSTAVSTAERLKTAAPDGAAMKVTQKVTKRCCTDDAATHRVLLLLTECGR